jgi:hypothetical protein
LREARERLDRERGQATERADGDGDGDEGVAVELDPERFVTRPRGRRPWLREGRRTLDAERERRARPIPHGRTDRLFEACRRLERELDVDHASNAAYEAWRARGVAADGSHRMAPGMVKPYQPPVAPQSLVNVTDHDSRVVRTHGQPPLQGYNAQMAVNDQQLVIAAEITTESPDFGHLESMVRATQREPRAIELDDPDVVLADAGYWHQRQIEAVVSDGMQVLVPPDAGPRKGARPGRTGGLYDFMRRVLATPDGRALYRQRHITIEPVFGQIKFNRQLRRFQRPGRSACTSEWRFIAATHNLPKLHHHRLAAVRPDTRGRRRRPTFASPTRPGTSQAAAAFPDSLASKQQCSTTQSD